MALRDRCPQTVPAKRSNQTALTYRHQQRGLQVVSNGHKTKWGLFLELGDNSGPRSVIPHHQDFDPKILTLGKKFALWNFKNALIKDLVFLPHG